jgi:hypothetical protein
MSGWGKWIAGAILLSLLAAAWSHAAHAYRPFDGTDAAVTDPGVVEIELGPSQYLELGSTHLLVAPDVVLNYGIGERWELVLQSRLTDGLDTDSPGVRLLGNGVFLKGVLREGSLQDKPGPSIATEFGLLLPPLGDEPGTGASFAAIVSQRWPSLTVHLNAQAAMTRQQNPDMAFSLIVEGSHDWTIRPVAELFYEREFRGSEAGSLLVGAIWQVRDNVAFDVGLRAGWIDGQPLREIRAGVTFSFGVFAARH